MRIIAFAILFTSVAACCQDLPDAPKPQTQLVHVYTFRKHYYDPPLRTNKQLLKSKYFVISQAVMWTSLIVACKRHNSTGEEFHSEAPMTGMVTFLSILTDKYLDELYAVGTAGIVTQHYIRANIEGPINY